MINYEFHSPMATTVKAVYVQQGEGVTAGKLLLQLDDVEARARVASAESGVRSAALGADVLLIMGRWRNGKAAESDLSRAHRSRPGAA